MPGPNTVEAVATDAAGNVGRHSITVDFEPLVGERVVLGGGNGQAGPVRADLPVPLMARVEDEAGNPIAGRLVQFRVTRNDGLLSPLTSGSPARLVQVPTDGSGRAAVILRLGDTTGEGTNRVVATAVGVAGEVEFCATGHAMAADQIHMTLGDNQRGAVGMPLTLPLEARVTDAAGNPVAGVPVTFSVAGGGGNLDGAPSAVRATSTAGLARAVLTLGPQPGINHNVVLARFEGLDGLPASFTASAVAPGDPAATSMSGVVLDNAQTPIPGASVSVEGAGGSAAGITGAQGQFHLTGVPVGHVHVHVDPAASPRPESFPPIAFETTTIAGQDNTLGQPVRIPALDPANWKTVGGPQDVTLEMAGVPGLTLTVFASSATFPDGARTGRLNISQVHLDMVPMQPPEGSFFMPPAWTVQPHGVVFDPPARITIPNAGLPAGRVVDVFQFDHGLNQFISIGKGTVSEDASVIVSDPGFGVTRAGWGGIPQPPPPVQCDGNTCKDNNRDDCKEPTGNTCAGCQARDKPDGELCKESSKKGCCDKGTCRTCPKSIVIEGPQTPLRFPQGDYFDGRWSRNVRVRMGMGILARMRVKPDNVNWDGIHIMEEVTLGSNTCPAGFPVMCSANGTQGLGAGFIVGAGGLTPLGLSIQAIRNTFVDGHIRAAGFSPLHQVGVQSCTYECHQIYKCDDGREIGKFLITYSFSQGSHQGENVTVITVNKTPE